MFKTKHLNHISTSRFIQTVQMTSQTSLWLFKIQALIVKWFVTLSIFFHRWSYLPVTVSVFLWNMISHLIPLHPLRAGTPLPTTRQTGSNHRWGRQDLARESVIELRLHTQLNLCPCNASMARRAARSAPISAIVTPKHQQYSNMLLHCDLFRQQSASSPLVHHVPPYRHGNFVL